MAQANAVSLSHYSPGRLRLKAPALKRDRMQAERIRHTLQAVPGIKAVTTKALTGSLLIEFSPETLRPPAASQQLVEALAGLFPGAFSEHSISVRIAGIEGGSRIAQRLKEKLATIEAIESIDIDHGQFRIQYDPNKLSIPLVLDSLAS